MLSFQVFHYRPGELQEKIRACLLAEFGQFGIFTRVLDDKEYFLNSLSILIERNLKPNEDYGQKVRDVASAIYDMDAKFGPNLTDEEFDRRQKDAPTAAPGPPEMDETKKSGGVKKEEKKPSLYPRYDRPFILESLQYSTGAMDALSYAPKQFARLQDATGVASFLPKDTGDADFSYFPAPEEPGLKERHLLLETRCVSLISAATYPNQPDAVFFLWRILNDQTVSNYFLKKTDEALSEIKTAIETQRVKEPYKESQIYEKIKMMADDYHFDIREIISEGAHFGLSLSVKDGGLLMGTGIFVSHNDSKSVFFHEFVHTFHQTIKEGDDSALGRELKKSYDALRSVNLTEFDASLQKQINEIFSPVFGWNSPLFNLYTESFSINKNIPFWTRYAGHAHDNQAEFLASFLTTLMFDKDGKLFGKLAKFKQLAAKDKCASDAYSASLNLMSVGATYGEMILGEFRSRMSFGETIPDVDNFQKNLMKLKALFKEEGISTNPLQKTIH